MMRGDRKARGATTHPRALAIAAGRQEGEGSEQADVPFSLGPKLCGLVEGGDAAEPDVIDPSPSFGNCGKQSITAFGPHRRFSRGRMNDALHRREVWRGPCEPDRGHLRTAGSLLIDDGVFGLIRRLARRNEADFQCLGFDNHALDMAFDQVAIRKGGRRLLDAYARRHTRGSQRREPARGQCCPLRFCDFAKSHARHS